MSAPPHIASKLTPTGLISRQKQKRPEPVGAFYLLLNNRRCLTFAVAGQQGWFFTAWAAWQLIKLLSRRETIALGLFVHDLRCWLTVARPANRWLLTRWLVFACRTTSTRLVFATSLTVTAGAVARTAAFGRCAGGVCAGARCRTTA